MITKLRQQQRQLNLKLLKADRTAPEGIESVASTLEENADGKITGVTDEMEYRAEGEEEYTAVTETEIANVKAGKYYVRYADSKNYKASEDTEVEVATGRKLNVTLTNGTGYTLTTEYEASVVYGAARAAWYPLPAAASNKQNATAVLPVPTSPCTRELTGFPETIRLQIASTHFF